MRFAIKNQIRAFWCTTTGTSPDICIGVITLGIEKAAGTIVLGIAAFAVRENRKFVVFGAKIVRCARRRRAQLTPLLYTYKISLRDYSYPTCFVRRAANHDVLQHSARSTMNNKRRPEVTKMLSTLFWAVWGCFNSPLG